MGAPRIALMCRFPIPGQAKTRLIPQLGAEGAADTHRQLAERTVRTVRASGVPFVLWGTGADEQCFVDWLGPLAFRTQGQGDLGDRLLTASYPYPVILIGTDAPDLTPEHLQRAATALEEGQFVLGPAADGGYWLLGLPYAADTLFRGVEWGTETVLATTRRKLDDLGVEPLLLPQLHDLDRPEDLARWPDLFS